MSAQLCFTTKIATILISGLQAQGSPFILEMLPGLPWLPKTPVYRIIMPSLVSSERLSTCLTSVQNLKPSSVYRRLRSNWSHRILQRQHRRRQCCSEHFLHEQSVQFTLQPTIQYYSLRRWNYMQSASCGHVSFQINPSITRRWERQLTFQLEILFAWVKLPVTKEAVTTCP